jgi:hypothetical protein
MRLPLLVVSSFLPPTLLLLHCSFSTKTHGVHGVLYASATASVPQQQQQQQTSISLTPSVQRPPQPLLPLRRHVSPAYERRQKLRRRAQPPRGNGGNVSDSGGRGGSGSNISAAAKAKADALGAFQRWYRAAKKAEAAKNKGGSEGGGGGGGVDNTSPEGPAADTPLPADDPLVEAVRKDFNAWTMYKRHERLPERLHSEGMDLSVISHRRDDDNTWLEYLTPFDRARALALRDASREYVRLGLARLATREAWLAEADAEKPETEQHATTTTTITTTTITGQKKRKKTKQQQQQQQQQQPNAAPDAEKAAGSETRQAKLARLQTAYNTYTALYQAGKRAQMTGMPRAAPAEKLSAPRPPWEWERYLLPHQRAHAAAVRERYYEFKELGLENAARRDAWLADAGEEGRAARLERYEQLHHAYLERPRLYIAAMSRQKRQQRRQEAGSKTGGTDDVSWMEHLTERERKRAMAARRAADEYESLGLNRKVTRDAWLVEDPDAVEQRRAKLEALLLDISEYNRLMGKAKYRIAKQLTDQDITTKQKSQGKQVRKASERLDAVDGEGREEIFSGRPSGLEAGESND